MRARSSSVRLAENRRPCRSSGGSRSRTTSRIAGSPAPISQTAEPVPPSAFVHDGWQARHSTGVAPSRRDDEIQAVADHPDDPTPACSAETGAAAAHIAPRSSTPSGPALNDRTGSSPASRRAARRGAASGYARADSPDPELRSRRETPRSRAPARPRRTRDSWRRRASSTERPRRGSTRSRSRTVDWRTRTAPSAGSARCRCGTYGG